MKIINILAILFACWALVSQAVAEVAVIVNPNNDVVLSKKEIAEVFLGKSTSFGNGVGLTFYYASEGSPVRAEFNSKVIDKSAAQLKAYWAKLLFSGKGIPPEEITSVSELLSRVASESGAIAYINASEVNDSVRVVGMF